MNDFHPKVSVILTSYNKPSFVAKAIESILAQSLKNFELFIMDDNSNEETQAAIRPYLQDPRVRYYCSNVRDEERFRKTRYAVLINQALALAKGEYISYATDDDYYHRQRLELMSRFLDTHPSVHVVYSEQQITALGNDLKPVQIYVRKTAGILSKAFGRVDHCSVMHRRSILEPIRQKYGNYWDEDPKYWGHGDGIFWNRIGEMWKFYPLPIVLDYNLRTPLSYKERHLGLPSFHPGSFFLPDGTLVKGTGSSIFYIDEQRRRPFHDMAAFHFWRFSPADVIEIPDPQLFQIPLGEEITKDVRGKSIPGNLLIKSLDRDAIYLTQRGRKRLIDEYRTFRQFGFRPERVILLPQPVVDGIEDGPVLSALKPGMELPDRIVFRCNGRLYLSHADRLYPVDSDYVKDKLKIASAHAVALSPQLLQHFRVGKSLVYHW